MMARRLPSDSQDRDSRAFLARLAGLRTMLRMLRRTAVVAAGFVGAGVLLLGFVAFTAPGARLVLEQLHRFGIPVTVEGVSGRLVGPLQLRGLRLSRAHLELEVDSVDLDWTARELLFQRRLHLERLRAVGVQVAVSRNEDGTGKVRRGSTDTVSSRLQLPLDIVVDRAQIERVEARLPGDVRVERGRLTLAGTGRDFQLEGNASIATPRTQEAGFRLIASGSLDSLKVSRAEIEMPAGELAASGDLIWYPTIRWSSQLEARDVDPSTFLPDSAQWPGQLELRSRATGRVDAQGLVASVVVDTVYGSLRGRRIAGRAALNIDSARVGLARVSLEWGAAHLRGSGTMSDSLNLDVDLEIPDLSLAIPDASGTLRMTGSVVGPKRAPAIHARFAGQRIRLGGERVARLNGAANLALGNPDSVRLSVRAADATLRGRALDSLAIDVRGTRPTHRIEVALAGEGTQLQLTADGGLETTEPVTGGAGGPSGAYVWRGSLEQLELSERHAGKWELEGRPVGMVVASDKVALRRELCLTSGGSGFCLSGAWHSSEPWRAGATIRSIPLELTDPFLPAGWSLAGDLDGDVQASAGVDGRVTFQAHLRPGPGRIGYPAGGPSEIEYERGTLDVLADSDGAQATLSFGLAGLDGDSVGEVRGRLQLPDYRGQLPPSRGQSLTGSAQLRLRDLAALEALAPQLERLKGTVALDLKLDGTVESPTILGEASLRHGSVDVPALGLELRELDLSATGEPDGRIEFEGGVRSGDNRLEINGNSRLVPSREAPSRLDLEGKRLLAMNTDQARIEASPKLKLQFDGDLLRIDGEVVVDTADIRLGEAESVVRPSPDVVFVDSAATTDSGLAISARVLVSLDHPVSIEGFGFSGRLSGDVLVNEDPGEPTRGSGELVVEQGQYSALGQTLTIEKGRLIFAGGPIDNPGLDLLATRATEDVKVGMQVTGTANAPLVTLYSEPPLPQDRIVTILAAGGALEGTGGQGGNVMESAKTKLGLEGANLLTRQVAAQLGMEAYVESGGSLGEASLIAGKYLSPRLYVKYGLSLVDPLRILQLRYMLSSKWTLVAETGDQSGADLVYHIETGI